MAATTELNESLTAIAIAFVGQYPRATLKEFIDLFYNTGPDAVKKFNDVVKNCEINKKSKSTYTKAYSKPTDKVIQNQTVNNWFAVGYFSAKALERNLGVSLSRYKVMRTAKSDSPTAYYIKSTCLSEIKKIFKQSGGKSSTLIRMHPDKWIIADLILYNKNSNLIGDLKEGIRTKKLTLSEQKKMMNVEFENKNVIPVSLKEINTKNPKVKFINAPTSITLKEDVQDEFNEEIMILQQLASSGQKAKFLKKLENMIEITYPINFKKKDARWKIYFKLQYQKMYKNYSIWTNYSAGGNSIHISEEKSEINPSPSKSSSGEGGLTAFYFEELSNQYISLRRFFKSLKEIRIKVFKDALNDSDLNEYFKNITKSRNFNHHSLEKMFYPGSHYIELFEYMVKNGDSQRAIDFYQNYVFELTKEKVKINNPNELKEGWLLSSYEFGYFFSKHQKLIKEIVKHQILLTWLAAASGRGFIIINRRKFSQNDFFQRHLSQPPAYIKVGY
jgi:hypothetical protein